MSRRGSIRPDVAFRALAAARRAKKAEAAAAQGWSPAIPAGWRFEVDYGEGRGWEPRETARALEILGDAYKPLAPIMDLLLKGQEIRTPFAFYRLLDGASK